MLSSAVQQSSRRSTDTAPSKNVAQEIQRNIFHAMFTTKFHNNINTLMYKYYYLQICHLLFTDKTFSHLISRLRVLTSFRDGAF